MNYQLRCPKCGYEFHYDYEEIETKLKELKKDVSNIQTKFLEIKALPYHERIKMDGLKCKLNKELQIKNKEIRELKLINKTSMFWVRTMEHQVLKRLIKEKLGQSEYEKIINQVIEETQAYNYDSEIKKQLKHEYTKANYKTGVTSIGKL